MKRRECTQWKEAKSGANIERASLGHCSHICLLVLNINVWRSTAAREVIQRHRLEYFAAPTPLLLCFMVPAKVFLF